MKITVLRNLGTGLPQYKEGEVVDVDDAEGERLIKLGVAETHVEPADIKAVPRTPAIGKAKAEPGTVERATEDIQEFKDRGKRSPATPAVPESFGINPHDASKK